MRLGILDLLSCSWNMKYYQMPAGQEELICFLDIQKLFGIAFEHKKGWQNAGICGRQPADRKKISRSTGHSVMLIIRRLYCRKYRRISRNIVLRYLPASKEQKKRRSIRYFPAIVNIFPEAFRIRERRWKTERFYLPDVTSVIKRREKDPVVYTKRKALLQRFLL